MDRGVGVPEELLSSLHPLEIKVLAHLRDGILLTALAKAADMQEVEATRALQWLENKGAVTAEQLSETIIQPYTNAQNAVNHGLPEEKIAEFIKNTLISRKEKELLIEHVRKDGPAAEGFDPALGILSKKGLIVVDKGVVKPTTNLDKLDFTKDSPELVFLKELVRKKEVNYESLSKEKKKICDDFKKRKNYLTVKERKDKRVTLTDLGKLLVKVDLEKLDFAQRLTREDLESGAWKEKRYRAFDVTVNVPAAYGGREHFTEEALEYARRIWLEMGFREMEGPIVQSAFWDLDALFVPQDHPAREMQDTFYLEDPKRTSLPKEWVERVRAVHEDGGKSGSLGWRTAFDKGVSERLLLRTHTTALSAMTLAKIREGKLPIPGKYFAIGKCFRNEAVDWKHLFEFNQVEGIVVDPNVNFAQLLGYLKVFFAKMGYPEIRLRPSHFPYTEPSVEIDVFHPVKKQWVEFGGAGVFRPEVTKALLGEDIPVLAWGPGFDRIIVEYFGIADLRDLYRNDMQQLREMRRFIRSEGD